MMISEAHPLAADEPANSSEEFEPLYRKALALVLGEQVETARSLLPSEPRFLSGQRRPHRLIYTAARRKLIVVCAGSSVAVILNLVSAFLEHGEYIGVVAVLAGVALAGCLLAEVLNGSGWDVESEYQGKTGLFREYSFEPSLRSPGLVFSVLALVLTSVILGYADLYLWLSRHNPKSFSGVLDGVSAVIAVQDSWVSPRGGLGRRGAGGRLSP